MLKKLIQGLADIAIVGIEAYNKQLDAEILTVRKDICRMSKCKGCLRCDPTDLN
jgi:hypothetical protein